LENICVKLPRSSCRATSAGTAGRENICVKAPAPVCGSPAATLLG
jgi:hypothetical protein